MGKGKDLADTSMAKISAIENRLSGALTPVAPRREFVNGLGQRIQSGNRSGLVYTVANWHILAMLIAGFVSLAVVLAMVMRALVTISGKRPAA
jgi:hypothetical protein